MEQWNIQKQPKSQFQKMNKSKRKNQYKDKANKITLYSINPKMQHL